MVEFSEDDDICHFIFLHIYSMLQMDKQSVKKDVIIWDKVRQQSEWERELFVTFIRLKIRARPTLPAPRCLMHKMHCLQAYSCAPPRPQPSIELWGAFFYSHRPIRRLDSWWYRGECHAVRPQQRTAKVANSGGGIPRWQLIRQKAGSICIKNLKLKNIQFVVNSFYPKKMEQIF